MKEEAAPMHPAKKRPLDGAVLVALGHVQDVLQVEMHLTPLSTEGPRFRGELARHGISIRLSSPVLFEVPARAVMVLLYVVTGNIYHQYTPNVSIYTIHGSYGIRPQEHHYGSTLPSSCCQ